MSIIDLILMTFVNSLLLDSSYLDETEPLICYDIFYKSFLIFIPEIIIFSFSFKGSIIKSLSISIVKV